MIPSYCKIFNLGHAAIKELLLDPVVVEEKVDGSQFSFMLKTVDKGGSDGPEAPIYELHFHSKEAEIIESAPPKMFKRGVEAVSKIAHLLTPDFIYRGEYLDKPKHNTLCYDAVPPNHVILFDITSGPECYLSPLDKLREASRLGFMMVPTIFEGKLETYDQFSEMLKRQSILGGAQIEGVVIKNYARFGKDGKALMGKFVREEFREMNKGDFRQRNPTNGDVIQLLIQELTTPARWEKAIGHLRDRGELLNDVKDIGPLFKEVQQDVAKECSDLIKERLFKHAWKAVGRGVVAGLPEWYKERLAKQQFEGPAPCSAPPELKDECKRVHTEEEI